MAASRIAGITVEIGGDTTKLTKALSGVDKSIKSTQSALKDVNRLLKLDPSSTELLSQKQKNLKAAIDETKDRLKTLQEAAKSGDLGAAEHDALQREIAETEQKLESLEKEYKEFGSVAAQKVAAAGQKMQEFGNKVSSVGKGISDFGSKLTTTVSLPLAAVGAAGVASFAEVDKTMQLTNKTMGSTAEEAEALGDAMKDAAANSTYGMKDAANATLNFARAGLDASQAADALAPAMNLAAGEGGNLDTVSAGLVATINGFHGAFSEAGRYADVFAAACNNSALDVDSLSSAMSVAAPIFASAGYSVNDAALYMGVMANNGIEADKAANSLKTGIARLVSPAKEGAEKMEELGISITNADGSMKDSVTIQNELHDAFGRLSESEQIAAASAIFGKNQMSPWLALINTAPEDVDSLNESLETCSGTTEEMADAMMGGFGGSLEKLKSSIDVLVTSIGESLAPVLQKAADIIQQLVDKFNALTPEQQEQVVQFGLLVAAAGPAIAMFGKLESSVGGAISTVGGLAAKLPALQGALAGISAPVAAVVAVIGTLAAAFAHLWSTNEEFRDKITGIWEGIKAKFEEFTQGIVERLNALGFDFESIVDVLKAVWDGFCSLLAPVFEGAFAGISNVLGTVLDVLTGILDVFIGIFTGNWEQAWNGVKEIFSGVWDGVKNAFSIALTTIQGIADAVLGWFGTSWNEAWTGIQTFFTGLWDGIVQTLSTVWETIKTTVSTAVTNIGDGIRNGLNTAKDTVTNIFDSIKTAISDKINAAKDAVHDAIEKLKGFFHFEWSLPKIKLPHFSISGEFSLNPPSIPHFGVDWYKKAMGNPILLNDATIFGASGGKLLGGGEAGSEMIVGTDKMLGMIQRATGGDTLAKYAAAYLPYLAEIAAKDFDVTLDGKSITKTVERNITQAQRIRSLQGGTA